MKSDIYDILIKLKGLLESIKDKSINWKEFDEYNGTENYVNYLDIEFNEIYMITKKSLRELRLLYKELDGQDTMKLDKKSMDI